MADALTKLIYEKNPTGVADMLYPLTEDELYQLADAIEVESVCRKRHLSDTFGL